VIARTETRKATTNAIIKTYQDSGIVKMGEYVTAGDDAVRPSHASLDGVKFPIDSPPGELQDVGCRCTLVAVL
jgi:SPP1 gp7 family putative phage head morphogenesis protein